jgi:hypothetical protein
VLALTVVPVIAGLAANEAFSVGSRFLSAQFVAPIWTLQLGLGVLFLVSWPRAGDALRAAAPRPR